jgi:hypothetical protein
MGTRVRTVIIELFTEKAFPNELQASNTLNISRYYIRESIKYKIRVKNALGEKCAFAPYYFGMDVKEILKIYT